MKFLVFDHKNGTSMESPVSLLQARLFQGLTLANLFAVAYLLMQL